MDRPGYWMHETTGVLRPAVEAYVGGKQLSLQEIRAMRAYLRQLINADAWEGADGLRARVDGLTTRNAIDRWLDDAFKIGIDPL